MERAPTVSVAMPVFNREDTLGEAIESVLAQSHRDLELVIVDDGSSDRSGQIARTFAARDPRVRVYAHDGNRGVGAARQRALELARGRWVANLDSDDVAEPRRLERQLAWLEAHPQTVLLGGWARRIDGRGRRRRLYRRPVGCDRIRALLLFRNCFKNTTVVARRDVLLHYGYRPELEVNEDVDLHVRIALDHPVANLPVPVCRYRVHGGSLSRGAREATRLAERRIVRDQLERLGLAPDEGDVELHHRLRRPRRAGFSAGELDRLGDWLCGLDRANQRAALYPASAFREALVEMWWRACRHAHLGRTARWRRFAQSPLASVAARALASRGLERLRGTAD